MTTENTTQAHLDLLRDLLEKTSHRAMKTPKDFDFLTQTIYEHTNQQLNPSTLKRFYGYVGSVKVPRESTLDILCQYVGYPSWQEFVNENDDVIPPSGAASVKTEDSPFKEDKNTYEILSGKNRKVASYGTMLFMLLVCLGLWYLLPTKKAEEAGYHFSRYTEAGDTLYFKVIDQDSAFVAVIARSDTLEDSYRGDITIPDTVTYNGITYTVREIGRKAFYRCHDIVSINLPPSLRRIDERAFQYNDSLAVINIPDSVNRISFKSMASCLWLRTVHLPEQLTEVPEACFFFDSLLVSIEIPRKVKAVGRDAFACCVSLKEVRLPSGLRKIGRGAFWECHGLESITIPAKVTEFGDFVFWGCDHLKDIYMLNPVPPRITDIFRNIHPTIHVPASSLDAYRKALYWEDQKVVGSD